jgi:hypothetical protein
MVTKLPNLFWSYGLGLLPSRLDEKLPINPALLPVLRALSGIPRKPYNRIIHMPGYSHS